MTASVANHPSVASPQPHSVRLASMSRPQVGIERLPARRPTNEPRESMNCKSCRIRKVRSRHVNTICDLRFVFGGATDRLSRSNATDCARPVKLVWSFDALASMVSEIIPTPSTHAMFYSQIFKHDLTRAIQMLYRRKEDQKQMSSKRC